jgi:hypothetical protein
MTLGAYWSPTYDVDSGMGVKLCDSDTQKRSAAGSLRARSGVRWRELPLDLSGMPLADFKSLLRFLRGLGRSTPFACSVFPEDADALLEAETRIVGMLTDSSEFTLSGPDNFATKINIASL